MAMVKPTRLLSNQNSILAYEWVLSEGDTAVAIDAPRGADKTVQVFGNFGAGGDVRLEGTISDKDNFTDLHDPQGNVISFATAGIAAVLEHVAFIRPRVAAGTGVSVSVHVLSK